MTGTIAGIRQPAENAELSHLLEVSERLIDGLAVPPASETDRKVTMKQYRASASSSLPGDARLIVGERPVSRTRDFERSGPTRSGRREGADANFGSGLNAADTTDSLTYRVGKRIIDIVGASVALILLLPLLVALAVLIRLGSPGPIFHRRRVLARQGYDGRDVQTYDAFKFRTMIVNADGYLQANPQLLAEYTKDYKLSNDPRVTRVGAPLRRLSLDELPQLWNILRGQMSLVGPRMISPPELKMYGADAARLLSVKPGLTGLWQVSGRTNVHYQERVHLDMYYVENRSLWLDIEILVRTVGCVLARRGAV